MKLVLWCLALIGPLLGLIGMTRSSWSKPAKLSAGFVFLSTLAVWWVLLHK
jgi:hypothetical protein